MNNAKARAAAALAKVMTGSITKVPPEPTDDLQQPGNIVTGDDELEQDCPNCGSVDCLFDDGVAQCPSCGYCGITCAAQPDLLKRAPTAGGPHLRPAAATTAPATRLAELYRERAASITDPVLAAGYRQLAQREEQRGG
jgi:hypothetical protein